ncbi:MAG: Flp family type IVb pilin, partial [Planctomycetota bacterium]
MPRKRGRGASAFAASTRAPPSDMRRETDSRRFTGPSISGKGVAMKALMKRFLKDESGGEMPEY